MTRDDPPPSPATAIQSPQRPRALHLVLYPAIGMAAALGLFSLLDRLVLPALTGAGAELYGVARTVTIGVLMASLIGYLVLRYRSGYEAELRARNEVLEATRDFLSGIIGDAAEAIITRDAAGRITSWNPAAEAIYGWTRGEMLGQTADRLIPPDPESREGFARIEAALRHGETVRDVETRRVRKDGKIVTLSVTLSPTYDRAGLPTGSMSIVRDVTSLKELESRLVEKERLAAVGELAAMVAHEVRNPLAGIRGGCEILLEGYSEGETRHDIGLEVIRQVDRLNRIVQDLLLFARPRPADRVPTELHSLLDRVLSAVQRDLGNRGVALRRAYGEAVPVVSVDPRQMEQLFLNLLLNACQAVGHRGQVEVGTGANVSTVEVWVADDGPGVPPEKVEQIFKPFFTTRAQGTGLGLAICRRIAEAHDGRIVVTSPPEGGARFVVVLPAGE